ncbi:type VI secretion system protein ImpH [Sinobacterium caligoides]|uniref:Type VI secretion system protein ImpH n=1 Tax=Sinobacterium caligoides TaxID=933926 RepID=A0A3N2DJT9_9GAMM|nr:type VI secretion system baseplate subunit TssG [Sinobacterium caligoides]ROS00046.1 type VI secretion system protein ImpH [Sinobacterium caligoides]
MATTRRRQSSTLIPRLQDSPGEFDFFQAVRLLERAGKLQSKSELRNSEAIADGAPASKEVVRFRARHQLIFHASDIHSVDEEAIDLYQQNIDKRWSMEVNFLSFAGSQGILPHHISEIIQQRIRHKDHALKDYLDIFNHRTVSLFYKAWHKHQMPMTVERASLYNNQQEDIFTDILCSMAGLTPRQMQLSGNNNFSIAGISGLLSRNVASAEALKKIIKFQLGLAVSIEEFIGQWVPIDPRIQSQLPSQMHPEGLNVKLGSNVVIGENSWQLQNKFRVRLAPLDYEGYMALKPGSSRLKKLQSLIKFSTGIEQDCDIVVSVNSKIIPAAKLENTDNYQPALGWNTYLLDDNKHDQSIEVIISS